MPASPCSGKEQRGEDHSQKKDGAGPVPCSHTVRCVLQPQSSVGRRCQPGQGLVTPKSFHQALPHAGEGMGAGGGCWCHPPLVGFSFKSLSLSSHQRQQELKEELLQTGWMRSAMASQPAAELPQPGRPQPPEAPTSSFPAKPGYDFTATRVAQPQHRLQPCRNPARSPCPQPWPADPRSHGQPVGSRHVGADRGHSFCSKWLFYPSERGYQGICLFPLGAIVGEQHEDVTGSWGQRDPGDGLLALPITR